MESSLCSRAAVLSVTEHGSFLHVATLSADPFSHGVAKHEEVHQLQTTSCGNGNSLMMISLPLSGIDNLIFAT